MFVGRINELEYLNEKYSSNQAEFIVLYGRRRIGKTALLQEFTKGKKHIFYSGHQITDIMQLKRITPKLTDHFKQSIYSEYFSDWERVFQYIAENTQENEKSIVVFDEFPYMVESNSSIPSILQSMWDHYLSNCNVMLIVCGSSMSFMEKKILSEKTPLYGRTTGVLKINELEFFEARGFMPGLDIEKQIEYYSVFSGVPYYLRLIDPNKSIRENIKNNILVNGSVLFNEVEFLLKQELREISTYSSIIEAIALGHTKVNQIVQITGIDRTKLPYYFTNLIELGFIKKEYPSTIKSKEMSKSRAGIYVLANSFFRFYFQFVYPYLSELADGNIDVIVDELIMDRLSMFVGLEYEKICISMLRRLNNKKKLPIRALRIGRWWNKGTEIDVVAYDLNKQVMYGECKWKNEKMSSKVLDLLIEKSLKVEINATEKYYVMFSKSGFTSDLQARAKENSKVLLFDNSNFTA